MIFVDPSIIPVVRFADILEKKNAYVWKLSGIDLNSAKIFINVSDCSTFSRIFASVQKCSYSVYKFLVLQRYLSYRIGGIERMSTICRRR